MIDQLMRRFVKKHLHCADLLYIKFTAVNSLVSYRQFEDFSVFAWKRAETRVGTKTHENENFYGRCHSFREISSIRQSDEKWYKISV
jgi:hypothetical protein